MSMAKLNGRRTLVAALLAAVTGTACLGDEIKLNLNGDDVTYRNVRVSGMREGVLYYTLPGGRESTAPLESLTGLKVDKYPEYEQADALIAKNDLPGAEKLLRALNAKITEEHMRLLVGAKLVYVLDWSGRFNDAVKEYVSLLQVERGPFATNVRPRNLPKAPEERKKSAAYVDGLLRQSTDAFVQESLKELSDAMKDLEEAPAAPSGSTAPAPGAPAGAPAAPMQPPPPGVAPAGVPGAAAPARDPIVEALNSKQYDKALASIENRMKDGGQLSTLLLQRGQAELGLGRDMDAAVSYMRVVIHFARSDSATVAMVEAGKIFQKLGKAEQARKLYTEARGRATRDAQLSQEIDRLLASING